MYQHSVRLDKQCYIAIMYQSLDHLSSLLSESLYDSRDVHRSLHLPLLQDMVYDDECPRPTHSSTAEVGEHMQIMSTYTLSCGCSANDLLTPTWQQLGQSSIYLASGTMGKINLLK